MAKKTKFDLFRHVLTQKRLKITFFDPKTPSNDLFQPKNDILGNHPVPTVVNIIREHNTQISVFQTPLNVTVLFAPSPE